MANIPGGNTAGLFIAATGAGTLTDPHVQVVAVTGQGVTLTDRSGTITAGGTAQQLMPANAARKGAWLQNLSTGDLWINSLGTALASQPSMRVPPSALYEYPTSLVPISAISIIGTTTGQAFAAREA